MQRRKQAGTGRERQSDAPRRQVKDVEDVAPGRKAVRDLLLNNPENVDQVYVQKDLRHKDLDAILDLCRGAGTRFSFVPKAFLDGLHQSHQGVAARLAASTFVELDTLLALAADAPLPVILALDQVQDAGNVGTLARTLYGLGGGGIIVPRHGGAHLGPGAWKASAGTLGSLPVAKVKNLAETLEEAAAAGWPSYGTVNAPEAVPSWEFEPGFPAILVLGGEDKGVRPKVLGACSMAVRIPLAHDLDSINVAQAGAMLLGLMAKARLS